jgi:integrase
VGRSAFISRREGRYLFRARWPACLAKNSTSAFRISLRTADYKVAAARAARIGSWMLNVKAADDPEVALQALWPRLQALAVEPARDEADHVERSAFQLMAFEAQYRVRTLGLKPNAVVPGWDEHFVALVRENSRAANAHAAATTVEGRLERRRQELAAQAAVLAVLPPAPVAASSPSTFASPAIGAPVASGDKRSRLSEVLARFLKLREGEDGDRSAANDIAPIVQFAVDLWQDPCLQEVGPDQIVQLKQAMPEIPTTEGLPADKRSLFQRWSIAKECNYVLVNCEGKNIKLTRVSESTLRKRYRTGLNTFWKFLIDNGYVSGPAPDFSSSSKKNPPAVERDAFQEDELLAFLSRPLFTGCESISRTWKVGRFFCQTFFYWTVLIQLLCGMRPGEISQLRCVDVALLYDKWHFRFAKRSLLAEGDGDDDGAEDDTAPGGNDAKTRNAFRWIPVYPLLIELGLLRQRDAIVDDYLERKFSEAGGNDKLTTAEISKLTVEARQQWLFPDWKVYVLPTGEIRWSQAASKVWQYVKSKFQMTRQGLALYSARHTFKGFIDDVKGLSDRSRRIVMGHAPAVDTPGGYGPKSITEEQADVILQLSNRTIDRMSAILLDAKRRADSGELKFVDSWRNDERTSDVKLQDALEERAKQYR